MSRTAIRLLLAAVAMTAAACRDGDAPVGGISAEDAAQLNNAAEMLDASADDLAAPADGNDATGSER